MIRVSIMRCTAGGITAFQVSGHALTAPPGADLVCAAVSAVVQTALLGLTEIAGIPEAVRYRPGDIRWSSPQGMMSEKQDTAQTILETMVLGLKSIEAGHGLYIQVTDPSPCQ